MCDRSFGSGNLFWFLFKAWVERAVEYTFPEEWCSNFCSVLLPEQRTSRMQSVPIRNEETTEFERGLRNKLDATDATIDAVVWASKEIPLEKEKEGGALANAELELCFHSGSNDLCPVVSALFAPMGIWERANSAKTKIVKMELCPYVVPLVNHRTQNLQLLKNIVHQTILNKQPQKDLAASSTVLPFRMVGAYANSTGLLHGYNSLDRSKLNGRPSAELLHDPKGIFCENDLTFLLELLLREWKGGSSDRMRKSITDMLQNVQAAESAETCTHGQIKELEPWLLYCVCKKLMSKILTNDFQATSTTSACQVFLKLVKKFVEQTPSLRDFFPYARHATPNRKETRHPFHHLRFLLGSMTLFRDAALEGCHRNFSQILALTNLSIPGSGTAKQSLSGNGSEAVVNSSLFFKPATVYHLLPSVRGSTDQNEHKDTVSHHQRLQSFQNFRNSLPNFS